LTASKIIKEVMTHYRETKSRKVEKSVIATAAATTATALEGAGVGATHLSQMIESERRGTAGVGERGMKEKYRETQAPAASRGPTR
jgi:hypothetical protein